MLQGAPASLKYLTPEARQIHEEYWNKESLIYGFLMEGTRYQTPIFQFQGESDGPTVLIIGGTHGNEPAGFEAAHRLLPWLASKTLMRGTLFCIPEANKVADQRNRRRIRVPLGVNEEMGNLNRVYPGNSFGLPMERAAQQITELIREHGINLLIDLHESRRFHLEAQDSSGEYHGLGQSLIYTINEKATWLAMVVVDEMNSTIPSGVKQFSLAPGPVKHSAAWSAGEYFNIPAFTIETSRKLLLQERIEYQLQIVRILLAEWQMIQP